VLNATGSGATINTDEWGAYNHLAEADRLHVTVCHAPGRREWARDDDGRLSKSANFSSIQPPGLWILEECKIAKNNCQEVLKSSSINPRQNQPMPQQSK